MEKKSSFVESEHVRQTNDFEMFSCVTNKIF